jgi:hypothetical protein
MALLRIHRYASLDCGGEQDSLTAELKALLSNQKFPRHTWVNLWEAPSLHQYRLLPSVTAPDLRSMVCHYAAATLGTDDTELITTSKIGLQRSEAGRAAMTEVSFFSARSRDIEERLKPVIDAGFIVDGVTTTCGALWSQARLRPTSLPRDVQAVVAVGRSRSALGIFSNDLLLYGRELDWGFASTFGGAPVSFDREDFARNLALELRHSFLYVRQFWDDEVSQVRLCGDMPELRSLTAPLIERLNIEVEPLDTLEGIVSEGLPEGFADCVSAFRLAAAVACEPSPANLLPQTVVNQPRSLSAARTLLAAAASVALIVLIYALIAGRPGPQSNASRDARHLVPGVAAPVQDLPATNTAPVAIEGPRPAIDARPDANQEAASPQAPQWSEPLAAMPPPMRETALPESVALEPVHVLRGVLVSEGRRFAIIDGQVFSVGDRVASSVILSIESDAVVLEGAAGRTRLEMSRPPARVVRH